MADYVPASGNTANLEDRDEISGARVFDGEDQGKKALRKLKLFSNTSFDLIET